MCIRDRLSAIADPLPARHGPFALWRLREPAWTPGVLSSAACSKLAGGGGIEAARDARPTPASGADEHWTFAPAAAGSAFFAGRQYHPHWRARARGAGGVVELEPVRIDGLHLGFELPQGAEVLELEFAPWARWAWVPPLLVALSAALLGARQLLRRRNSRLAGSPFTGAGS